MSADSAAPESAAWWQAVGEGRLLARSCDACGRAHFYPRPICPLCGSAETAWLICSGKGEIYAFSITRRADPPYCIAYVQLDEGPIMLTHIVDADFDSIRIGQRVSLCMRPGIGGTIVPMFAPYAAR
jgi:uncharacterized OB-fold protein